MIYEVCDIYDTHRLLTRDREPHGVRGIVAAAAGSHKSNVGLPERYRDLSQRVMPAVRPVRVGLVRAGDDRADWD